MEITRRKLLAGAASVSVASGLEPVRAQIRERFTPEMFGAKGDGRTNDSEAFRRLAKAVNVNGGGVVELRRTTYIVGDQRPRISAAEHHAFVAGGLLSFYRCTKPVVLQGNGATLRLAPGLRYGTFDTRGNPTRNKLPFHDLSQIAVPYHLMVSADECSASVTIQDLELDGNMKSLQLGGEFGDNGRQIPGSGIGLRDNLGDEIIRNVHTHHHPLDGLMINGNPDAALARRLTRRIEGLRAESNGRLGCSITGGRGYAFFNSKFNRTGRAGILSAPGAGLDIEAEGTKINRDFSFTDCEFVDNAGCGMVADSGDSEGATFTRCKFVGTTAWSAWPSKPRFRFYKSTFIGALVRLFGDKDRERATQFHDCIFLDDPKLSPTGQVALQGSPHGIICDVSQGENSLFRRCHFKLTHNGVLPWSWRAIYEDCRMEQKASTQGFPKGRYLGTSTIVGNVDMYNTKVEGTLILNGVTYRKQLFGGEAW